MVGRLYHLGRAAQRASGPRAARRSFDLADAGEPARARPTRAACAAASTSPAALVARPPVLFLDEPTTGLDPRSRLALWETIEGLVAGGTTVLLTTQYLDEADRLADQIVGDRPRPGDRRGHAERAEGRDRRRAARGPARRRPRSGDAALEALARARGAAPVARGLDRAVAAARARGRDRRRGPRGSTRPASRSTTSPSPSPTLDDVFLQLTGHAPQRTRRSARMSSARGTTVVRHARPREAEPAPDPAAARTCWSASPSSRSCSCCSSSTSSAARSRRRALELRRLPDPRDHRPVDDASAAS